MQKFARQGTAKNRRKWAKTIIPRSFQADWTTL